MRGRRPQVDPRAVERADLLRRLRRSRDHVISQAGLAAVPNEAYEPVPPGLRSHLARTLNDVQHHCQYLIEIVLLGISPGAGSATLAPVSRAEPAVPAARERTFSDVAEEFRAETDRMFDLLDAIELDGATAGAMWVHSDVDGMLEERRRVTGRWVLLDVLQELSRAAGEFRTYWALAEGGHLVDTED